MLTFSSYSEELLIGINERDIYRYKDANGFWEGKDIALTKAVFARTQHSYKFVAMPWTRVLESIKSGTVDMTLAAVNLPERREYALFTKHPYRFSHYMLFINKSKADRFADVKQLADVMDKNIFIGALRGAIYSLSFHSLLQNQAFADRLVYIDDDQNMIYFAVKGRVDGYIDAEIEVKYYLKQKPELKQFVQPLFRITSDEEAQNRLMFSKKTVSQSIVDEFDIALQALHESGEYDRISRRFIQ